MPKIGLDTTLKFIERYRIKSNLCNSDKSVERGRVQCNVGMCIQVLL